MLDHLAVLPQYLLPKQALTALAGRFARARAGRCTTAAIRWFVRHYQVNMAEAANPDVRSYQSFNEFFTRALQNGARPMANAPWVSPVDGAVSQLGNILQDQIFQAKGHYYSIRALVGGDIALAALFAQGSFATLYLSPRDYHRIHMPCAGTLRRMIYVPGDLFSVNPRTARAVPGLFARNERVVCLFDTAHGPMLLTLVGATIVGSMATSWHGVINPPRGKELREWHYPAGEVSLPQGSEMGRFLLGSTVVLLFPRNTMEFDPQWAAAYPVHLGQTMGQAVGATRPG